VSGNWWSPRRVERFGEEEFLAGEKAQHGSCGGISACGHGLNRDVVEGMLEQQATDAQATRKQAVVTGSP
jgi:hypothetical protein